MRVGSGITSHIDTGYVRTYPVFMNVTLSIDDQLLEKARKHANAAGTSVNQMVRDYLKSVVGEDDIEADIAFFRRTSGQGNPPPDWKFDREEMYNERLDRYGRS